MAASEHFNSYFSTIGKKTQAEIKYSYKNYTDYLTNKNPNSFFLSLRDKEEINPLIASVALI